MSRPQKIHAPLKGSFNTILSAVALGGGAGKKAAIKLAKQAGKTAAVKPLKSS